MQFREQIFELLFSTPGGVVNGQNQRDIRNTNFFKILRANPSLAIFYADFLGRHGAKPSLLKDLGIESGIFFNPDQSPETAAAPDGVIPKSRAFTSGTRACPELAEGDLPKHTAVRLEPSQNEAPETLKGSTPMAVSTNPRTCSHIKVNGLRCGSPALRGEIFCYFHQRMIRGVRTPPKSRIHPMAMLEDEASIQASLMETINAIVRNQIDIERARLVLRALHIAARNARRANFKPFPTEVATEVPEYPASPEVKPPDSMLEQAGVLQLINKPKPRYPTDYGLTIEQAIKEGLPPEEFDPPRDLDEANANVKEYIEKFMGTPTSG
jgi:hypothetical protein